MEILDPSQACFMVDEDILDFTLDGGAEGYFEPKTISKGVSALLNSRNQTTTFIHEALNEPFPEFVEEELEWLSNKDAFPAVETCFGILSDNPELMMNHQSPVSVLENSSSSSSSSNSNTSNNNNTGNSSSVANCCGSLKVPTKYPVRARSRSKRRRRSNFGFGDFPTQQWFNVKSKQESSFSLPPLSAITNASGASMGRRCLHCLADKTPQWRAGPMGPKTLCNACGVRYKSGRLLPEYRPANSPTFSSSLHSNSHRKVVEMRRQKMAAPDGIAMNEVCGYRVG